MRTINGMWNDGSRCVRAVQFREAVSTEVCTKPPIIRGALAQLVARNVRIVEVRGSNPLCSTRLPLVRVVFFCEQRGFEGSGECGGGKAARPTICRFETALFVCAQRGFGKVHRRETLCFARGIEIRTGSGSDLILYAPYGHASIVFYEYWAFPRLFRGTFWRCRVGGQGIAR